MSLPMGERPSAGVYFFLSYAQVPPGDGGSPRDGLVDSFFDDLVARVGRLAGRESGAIGLYDQSIEPGDDVGQAVQRALGVAEVFVPLYSPRYEHGSWTRGERRSFEKRLEAVHADPARHIQPVLWMPFPSGAATQPAADLGADVPEYGQLGLGALCDVSRGDDSSPAEYRHAYEQIVERLAKRIVKVAEENPIGPSQAPSLESAPADRPTADFVIAVYAPTAASTPAGRDARAYGTQPADWSPFARMRPAPIIQQAKYLADRLDVSTAVVSLPGARKRWAEKPTVLLVDPWLFSELAAGKTSALLPALPPWVMPLIITDKDDERDAERATEIRDNAVAMLIEAGATEISTVDGIDGFMELVPILVTRARRRFFNAMPRSYPRRPRLGISDTRPRAVGDDE